MIINTVLGFIPNNRKKIDIRYMSVIIVLITILFLCNITSSSAVTDGYCNKVTVIQYKHTFSFH